MHTVQTVESEEMLRRYGLSKPAYLTNIIADDA